MLALKSFFEDCNCTVLLLDNLVPDVLEPQVHSIVHGVISLETLKRDFGIERRRLRVQKVRGSKYREGFHDYRILTGGLAVYPRLVAAEHRHLHKRELLQTGIEGLDRMLHGGISRGSATLLMGPAGVGKSSLSARFACSALDRGEAAAIYTFDETIQGYLDRSASLGANLRPHQESGRLHLVQLDPAELPPGEFVTDIRRAVSEKNASVVVIDSLNGCLNAMPDESFLQLQMHELLTYLNMQGVSTFLILAQQGIVGPVLSNIDISYLADSIILLRYFEAMGGVRKAISIFKKRSGPHETTIRELQLKPGDIVVGAPLNTFQGVLTGSPVYSGKSTPLLDSGDGDEQG
jgi:circadian clock protein KaiC